LFEVKEDGWKYVLKSVSTAWRGKRFVKLIYELMAALIVFGAAVLVAESRSQERAAPVAVGEMAPDFTLENQNGNKVTLSAARGKSPVVLVFYRGYW
jgi:cytochrome oxidase Cu insertion factor (SCO1/SenC/PrrC family)